MKLKSKLPEAALPRFRKWHSHIPIQRDCCPDMIRTYVRDKPVHLTAKRAMLSCVLADSHMRSACICSQSDIVQASSQENMPSNVPADLCYCAANGAPEWIAILHQLPCQLLCPWLPAAPAEMACGYPGSDAVTYQRHPLLKLHQKVSELTHIIA